MSLPPGFSVMYFIETNKAVQGKFLGKPMNPRRDAIKPQLLNKKIGGTRGNS